MAEGFEVYNANRQGKGVPGAFRPQPRYTLAYG